MKQWDLLYLELFERLHVSIFETVEQGGYDVLTGERPTNWSSQKEAFDGFQR